MVSDMYRNMLKGQEGTGDSLRSVSDVCVPLHDRININCWLGSRQVSDLDYQWTQSLIFASSMLGVPPPPPPRVFFGRDELIEKVVGFAESLTPIALIGTGGIGKTSIALAVLHHDLVKQRFGEDRRFIRCDQFPASSTHLLSRLSAVIGAGVQNPEDLTPLHPLLSSREIIIVLDNAESVLDPQGTDAQEIYTLVEELGRLETVCVCIASRISTVPPDYETLDIPTLSMESARDTFYRIFKHDKRPDAIDNVLKRLDFHPLSVTLLATVAHHNRWDTDRLTREWERHRTGVLHTQHNSSLAATIELSLTSPMFQELGPDARGLLGVVAFFPQGINENNIDWLFPTISDGINIFDGFCILSLTYRSNGFVTMLAPLRDYLCPKDPKSSPLLCATKECYFSRLSVGVYPGKPGYEEARWITSEDVNVEYLLDVFTTIDPNSNYTWDVCDYFMAHLYWHKPRLVVLGTKIEGLPDDHPSKPRCLCGLSELSSSVGRFMESKGLLVNALKICGEDPEVPRVLRLLSDANRRLGLQEEGVQQAKEALEICERVNDVLEQLHSLTFLARSLYAAKQFDAAEAAISRTIGLLPQKSEQFQACQCYHLLGAICYSKGEAEKAIDHFGTALGIASSFGWDTERFWIHYSMAELFCMQGRFDDTQTHIERAKLGAVNAPYLLGCAMYLQAGSWHKQRRFGEARSEVLRAIDAFGKTGAVTLLEDCVNLLYGIESESAVHELRGPELPLFSSMVPQVRYTRGNTQKDWGPKGTILFFTRDCLGVKLLNALHGKFEGMNDRDDPPFDEDCRGITIRIHVGPRGHRIADNYSSSMQFSGYTSSTEVEKTLKQRAGDHSEPRAKARSMQVCEGR